MATRDALDPKGLIEEAYRIEGITASECRSIFLDWALSFDGVARDGVAALLTRHKNEPKDHPMTLTLIEGLKVPPPPTRKGGRRGRVPDTDQ